jgi:hypothetical protein
MNPEALELNIDTVLCRVCGREVLTIRESVLYKGVGARCRRKFTHVVPKKPRKRRRR